MAKRERFEGYILVAPRRDSLHGFVFKSGKHAANWMRQPFVEESGYRLERVVYTRKPCCGEIVVERNLGPVDTERLFREFRNTLSEAIDVARGGAAPVKRLGHA